MPFVPSTVDEKIREAKKTRDPIQFEKGKGFFIQREKSDKKIQESYSTNGSMITGKNGVTTYRVTGLKSYFEWYSIDGVVGAAVDSLAEAGVGQGLHTGIEEEWPEKSKELVDELGKEINLDALNPNICKCMLIAGFCPVETKINKLPEKCTIKIIHPLTIHSFAADKNNKILWLKQRTNTGQAGPEIKGDIITWFVHNQIGNDLRGTSIIKRVESLLETKQMAIDHIDAIIDRKLYPIGVWKTEGEVGGLKNSVIAVEAGQDIFIGNLTPEEMKPGVLVEFINVEGDTKYWEYIEYIDRLIYKGLYAPDLYYWKDATLASAKELTAMIDRNINAIQRNMKRAIEAGFYERLMKANNIEDAVPRVIWGIEKIGVEDLRLELVLATGLELGYISNPQYDMLLKLMGLDLGKYKVEYGEEPEEEEPKEEPEESPDEGESEEEEK